MEKEEMATPTVNLDSQTTIPNYEISDKLRFFKQALVPYLGYFQEDSHNGTLKLVVPTRVGFQGGTSGCWVFDKVTNEWSECEDFELLDSQFYVAQTNVTPF
jgi:hypothetical protein